MKVKAPQTKPMIEGDLIEFLIDNPSYLIYYSKDIQYQDIYKFLMFRPEYYMFFKIEKMSKYSWEMILSEQPQMINVYIKTFLSFLSEEEVYRRVRTFQEKFEDIEFYL
jgi:hypothetical protein